MTMILRVLAAMECSKEQRVVSGHPNMVCCLANSASLIKIYDVWSDIQFRYVIFVMSNNIKNKLLANFLFSIRFIFSSFFTFHINSGELFCQQIKENLIWRVICLWRLTVKQQPANAFVNGFCLNRNFIVFLLNSVAWHDTCRYTNIFVY